MNPLQVTMIISATTMLLITALLLFIRTMPSRPGLRWWLSASLAQAIIYCFAISFFGQEQTDIGHIIFYGLGMFVTQALSIGTLLFAKVPVKIKSRIGLLVVAVAGVTTFILSGYQLIASVHFAVYNGAYLIFSAYYLYKVIDKRISFKIISALFFLNGVHWLDYPLLSRLEWFAPIGFMLGMILLSGAFLGLTVSALMQFKHKTQESEKRAIKAATTDALTGLYNRSHLQTLFDNYAKEADQIERSFILMYFDLDGFKEVNDTHGHKAGDLILTTVAERMRTWLGNKGDAIRIGGDELVVLTKLRGSYERKNALIAARHLLDKIEEPIVDGDKSHQISASIGGCCYSYPYTELEQMLNKSDKLMYVAKQSGGGQIYFSHSKRRTMKESGVEINLLTKTNDTLAIEKVS